MVAAHAFGSACGRLERLDSDFEEQHR
jgi:hypothetical protein